MDADMLELLAGRMILGELLTTLDARFGGFKLLDHWLQGEFHHDLVLQVEDVSLPPFLVVSTNCNGGIKEVLGLSERPERWALWNHRCPENDEFEGEISGVVGVARTSHWFDPCEILVHDARSELKPEFRTRQRGGSWEKV